MYIKSCPRGQSGTSVAEQLGANTILDDFSHHNLLSLVAYR